eukprot:423542_1
MVIYCIQSSQNTYYHQNQLINDDDDELINSYGFASVGIMNGHPSNQRLNIEDENVPFNALVLIVSNILVTIVLTLSGRSPYSHINCYQHDILSISLLTSDLDKNERFPNIALSLGSSHFSSMIVAISCFE